MSRHLSDKIKLIREKEGLSRPEFSALTGINAGSLKHFESGRIKSIGSEVIELITKNSQLEKYALWLITDHTAPSVGQIAPEDSQEKELSFPSASESNSHIHLPLYDVAASAGAGVLIEKEDQIKTISFEPEWLRKEIGVNPNDAFLMLVDGDSMHPTLKSGSMIMVDRNLNGLSDGIYVLRHDSSLLVKRLQSLPGGNVKVKSDNTMYEPWDIKREDFNGADLELIGRVVWTGQRL